MGIESFDDFDSSEGIGQDIQQKPFQFRDNPKSEPLTHEWLKNNFDAKVSRSFSRLSTYKRYNNFYKGVQWRDSYVRTSNRDTDTTDRRPKNVMNSPFRISIENN